MSADPITQLLRHSVYLSLDANQESRFRSMVKSIEDWEKLITQAEANALSSLLYSHLQTCKIKIPDNHEIIFKALIARHQRNNRERIKALAGILEKFDESRISSVTLKGMSLIHTLYSNNFQRPMGDIDILVKQDQAQKTQQQLRELGYQVANRKRGYLFNHHHLPVASKKINGLVIQVEIHHNALSGDASDSLSFQEVKDDLQVLTVEGHTTHSLGHIQMLKHLCHHTFEPAEKIKLGAIADIYGYASKYFHHIDWDQVRENHYIIINTLRCLHFLCPMPKVLMVELIAPTCPSPTGVGLGFPPLSSILISSLSLKEKLKKLFHCSHWWYHIFYQVKPESSLFLTRHIRHPLTVSGWLYRRILAKVKSQLHNKKS